MFKKQLLSLLMAPVVGLAFLGVRPAPAKAQMTPRDIFRKCSSAVVLIMGTDDGRSGSGGTGSIIRPNGLVVTNAHVVVSPSTGKPFKRINVFLKPKRVTGDTQKDLKRRFDAKVLHFDNDLDLALMKIENPPADLTFIELANSEDVEIGEDVMAIGHPEQAGLWTTTRGLISTRIANFNRVQGKNVFQTDASVNRGNSGGPLINSTGMMAGINTAIARKAQDGLAITGTNFALQAVVAKDWLSGVGVNINYGVIPEEPVAEPEPEPAPAPKAKAPEPEKPAEAAPVAPPPEKKVEEPPVTTEKEALTAEPEPEPEKKAKKKKVTKKKKKKRKAKARRFAKGKAAPTKRKPYNMDKTLAEQMKEMEDMMEDMRGRIHR